jgi:hypothetical protein
VQFAQLLSTERLGSMAKNTRNNLDLQESFDLYFNELEGFGLRSERFLESLSAFTSKDALAASMTLWLKAAYIRGARDMAQDTLDTLQDYGTACAGVDPAKYSLTDCFDKAHANLHIYYTQVLQDAETNKR